MNKGMVLLGAILALFFLTSCASNGTVVPKAFPGSAEIFKVSDDGTVEVKGYDLKGNELRFEAEGNLARAFQHEIDHLNGVLFWDNLSKVKRDIMQRKFKKKIKEMEA